MLESARGVQHEHQKKRKGKVVDRMRGTVLGISLKVFPPAPLVSIFDCIKLYN